MSFMLPGEVFNDLKHYKLWYSMYYITFCTLLSTFMAIIFNACIKASWMKWITVQFSSSDTLCIVQAYKVKDILGMFNVRPKSTFVIAFRYDEFNVEFQKSSLPLRYIVLLTA